MQTLIEHLNKMKANTLHNYVIAGLDSSLLTNGKVRLFENSRDHQDSITPHTHRFDFACLVLEGRVTHKIWEATSSSDFGDEFQVSKLTYLNEVGCHKVEHLDRAFFSCHSETYTRGDVCTLKHHQFHSIKFSRGAKVLFFEGPTLQHDSFILQPWVNDELITTYETKPYMFREST